VRLELKVTAWMAVLLGASAAIALGLMARFEAGRLEKQWTEAGLAMAQATENTLEVSMLNDAPEDIRDAVRNVEEGRLVAGVAVYGRDGAAWVRSDPTEILSDARQNALLASMDGAQSVTATEGQVLSVFVPILKQPECVACHAESTDILGAVEVRMDEAPFRGELATSARTSLILAAIPLLLGIVIAVWAIRRRVLGPLQEVDEAVERLGDGDLTVRLPSYKDAEFDEVAETFNDMAGRLERQSTDLRDTVESLRSELVVMEEIRTMLTEGTGLGDVLQRAAAHLGSALDATGVAIWCVGDDAPQAVWGDAAPDAEQLRRTADEGAVTTSAGALGGLEEEQPVSWVAAPALSRGTVRAVVGLAWEPARPLGRTERDLVDSLAGLVGIAVDNARLLSRLQEKEESLVGLVRKTLTAQEEERRRIARELHDETSQVLSALLMNISMLESQALVDDQGRARVAAVKALAEEAARNLDTMLFELRPALLDELGLIPALRWYLAQVGEAWQVPIAFEGEKTERLPDHVEVTAFRIVQEAVGNVVRHANATAATVRVVEEEGKLLVRVSDDGRGFDPAAVAARARTGESVGLMGMRERAELAGGALRVDSAPGAGTTVTAELPVTQLEGVVV